MQTSVTSGPASSGSRARSVSRSADTSATGAPASTQAVESDLNAFAALHKSAGKADDRHRIMIGPWAHNMSIPFTGIDLGLDSSAPIRAYQIEWFDHWLKGQDTGILEGPRFRYLLPEAEGWRTADCVLAAA